MDFNQAEALFFIATVVVVRPGDCGTKVYAGGNSRDFYERTTKVPEREMRDYDDVIHADWYRATTRK